MANELQLKYGCNPNQKPSRIFMEEGDLPVTVLNGKPGYINFMDAFNSWQLVKELKEATGLPAAASFKHVSPAGAAVANPLSDVERQIYFTDTTDLSPIASAYARARGADRMSSYGDFAALSEICDKDTALLLKKEVSDGVIAPGYTDEALEILCAKKKGNYNVIQMDPDYIPAEIERKQVYGIIFEQGRNNLKIDESLLTNIVTENKDIPDSAKRDLIVSLITLKYTQSNSVAYAKTVRQSASVQDSSPASTAQGLRAVRRITGGSGSVRRYWSFRLWTVSAELTETTPSTYTSPMSMRMYCVKEPGSSSSRRSLPSSQRKKSRNGWRRIQEYPLAVTHSSPLETILSVPIRAAFCMWRNRAVPSVMTMSSKHAISTTWQWRSQASVCSTIDA